MGIHSVYVAGRYSNVKLIRATQQAVRDIRLKISFDWTANYGETHNLPSAVQDSLLREAGKRDKRGVCKCDAVFAIMDEIDYPYYGTLSETGMALALNKYIVIVTGENKEKVNANPFFRLDKVYAVKDIMDGLFILRSLMDPVKK